MAKQKLRRSVNDRLIFGVCGGLGDYLGISPVFVRLGFLIAFVLYGLGVLLYLALAILMRREDAIDIQTLAGDPAKVGEMEEAEKVEETGPVS